MTAIVFWVIDGCSGVLDGCLVIDQVLWVVARELLGSCLGGF